MPRHLKERNLQNHNIKDKILFIKNTILQHLSDDKTVGWKLSYYDLSLVNRSVENYFNIFDLQKILFNN